MGALKWVGAALGLVIAAYLVNGLYVFHDMQATRPASRALRPATPETSLAAIPGPPTAPWAANHARLRRGEYATLVDNAWSSPGEDSMSFAAKALNECSMFIDPEELKKVLGKIDAAPAQERDLRLNALERLRIPCRALEGRAELLPVGPLRSKWFEAGRSGPYNQFLELLFRYKAPDRQERLRALMATNDPLTMAHLATYLGSPGATFEGEAIRWNERLAYQVAWAEVLCVNYDTCKGPDSRGSLLNCVNHGECFYFGPEVLQAILFPAFVFGDRTDDYYRRIQAHLDRRRYDAFGFP